MFDENVRDLIVGVHVSKVDFRMLVEKVEHPIKIDSMRTGHMSHGWRSLFQDHFYGGFVVLANR